MKTIRRLLHLNSIVILTLFFIHFNFNFSKETDNKKENTKDEVAISKNKVDETIENKTADKEKETIAATKFGESYKNITSKIENSKFYYFL